MATRQSTSERLVHRAQSVGWDAERVGNGWRINTPTGPYVIHMTYSDSRSLKNAEAELKRRGLHAAEKGAQEIRYTTRRAKLDADRAAAEKRAEQMANTAAVARAAGPYLTEPDTVELEWFTKPHPAPWARWVYVTPQIAAYILEHHNSDNRTYRDETAEYYRDVILSDQWHLTHQGGAMDTRGILQDCQHRFGGLVLANQIKPEITRLPFLFCVGMPVENFKAIDENLVRRARDLLMRGSAHEKNASAVASITRLVLTVDGGANGRAERKRRSNESILNAFEVDAAELRRAAGFGQSNYRKAKATPASLGGAYYLIRRANGIDNWFVAAFFEGYLTDRKAGTAYKLDDNDPRHVLRETLSRIRETKKRTTALEQCGLIIAAWNDLINNRRPTYRRITDDMPFPRIEVCYDTGAGTSATPELLAGETAGDHHAQ